MVVFYSAHNIFKLDCLDECFAHGMKCFAHCVKCFAHGMKCFAHGKKCIAHGVKCFNIDRISIVGYEASTGVLLSSYVQTRHVLHEPSLAVDGDPILLAVLLEADQ